MKYVRITIFSLILLALSVCVGLAQNDAGKWTIGIRGGANLWLCDYNKYKVGDGGELMLRYGITDYFSAGLSAGYEDLKAFQDPLSTYPRLTDPYLKLRAIPISLAGYFHLAPNSSLNPYIFAGFGDMIYQRRNGAGVYIPSNSYTTTVNIPMGLGFEIPMSEKIYFSTVFGYNVTDDNTDNIKVDRLDSYGSVKIGLNFRVGSSEPAQVAQETYIPKEPVTRVETVYVEKPIVQTKTDTLYITKTVEVEKPAAPPTDLSKVEKGQSMTLEGILFDKGSAKITKSSEAVLAGVVKTLADNPDIMVEIQGHTDNTGNETANMKLSARRADAVKAYLVQNGIAKDRLTAKGYGQTKPAASNDTPEGRAKNRRIQFLRTN